MKREIIQTLDGSVTIHLPEMNESYHSKFGAVNEAYHVFIKNGLALFRDRPVAVLEMGFGTGLNAFITYLESVRDNMEISYTGIEAYPVSPEEVAQLNYVSQLDAEAHRAVFDAMHAAPWGGAVKHGNFTLLKQRLFFHDIEEREAFDLVYFDAFGYHAQPELWTEEIFRKMYAALRKDGVLVTYACRTVIKKAMEASGFTVAKLAGPPGKREMLRAVK